MIFPNLPESFQARVARFSTSADYPTIGAVAAGALAVIDQALLAIATARFQRSRLILE